MWSKIMSLKLLTNKDYVSWKQLRLEALRTEPRSIKIGDTFFDDHLMILKF